MLRSNHGIMEEKIESIRHTGCRYFSFFREDERRSSHLFLCGTIRDVKHCSAIVLHHRLTQFQITANFHSSRNTSSFFLRFLRLYCRIFLLGLIMYIICLVFYHIGNIFDHNLRNCTSAADHITSGGGGGVHRRSMQMFLRKLHACEQEQLSKIIWNLNHVNSLNVTWNHLNLACNPIFENDREYEEFFLSEKGYIRS